jgi:hypothetical protein
MLFPEFVEPDRKVAQPIEWHLRAHLESGLR